MSRISCLTVRDFQPLARRAARVVGRSEDAFTRNISWPNEGAIHVHCRRGPARLGDVRSSTSRNPRRIGPSIRCGGIVRREERRIDRSRYILFRFKLVPSNSALRFFHAFQAIFLFAVGVRRGGFENESHQQGEGAPEDGCYEQDHEESEPGESTILLVLTLQVEKEEEDECREIVGEVNLARATCCLIVFDIDRHHGQPIRGCCPFRRSRGWGHFGGRRYDEEVCRRASIRPRVEHERDARKAIWTDDERFADLFGRRQHPIGRWQHPSAVWTFDGEHERVPPPWFQGQR